MLFFFLLFWLVRLRHYWKRRGRGAKNPISNESLFKLRCPLEWYGPNVCVLANLMIPKKKWKCLMKTSFSNCFLLYCKYNSSNTKWLTSRCQTHVHSLFSNSTQQLISSSSPRPSNSNRFQMKKRKRVDDGGVSKWKCSTSNVSSVSFVFSL